MIIINSGLKMQVVPPGCRRPHGLPLNPFRTRVWKEENGPHWGATYATHHEAWAVSGCTSQEDALLELRHFVRMKVMAIDGEFVEVVRA